MSGLDGGHYSEDQESVCGETFDHDARILDERDGSRTYVCDTCGAEWWEDSP